MERAVDNRSSGPSATRGNLEEMLAANRAFVAERRLQAMPDAPTRKLAVLTCMDSRLTGLWNEALGLQRGDAMVLRNAGNTVAASDDVLRSLAIAVYAKGVEEIVVLGHSDCGMTKIQASAFIDAMSRAGVSRDAIPSIDLREWLGAFAREEDNVRDTVRAIRESGLFSPDVQVHGLLLYVETGEVRAIQ